MRYQVNNFVEIFENEKVYIMNKKKNYTGQIIEIDLDGYDFFKTLISVTSLEEAVNKVLAEYDIPNIEELEDDIKDFVFQLSTVNIVSVTEGHNEVFIEEIDNNSNEYVQKIEEIQDGYMKEGKPFKFFLELTYNCNLKCKHCYRQEDVYIDKKECPSKHIDKNIIFQTLDDMEMLKVVELYVTGGEPFLHPDIFEIIEYASEKNFLLTILTNGHIFSKKENVEKIKEMDIYDIRISIYGLENSHDRFTRIKGSYKKTITALKNLNEILGLGTGVFVLTTLSYHDCGLVIKFFEENKINLTINSTISPTARGDLNPLDLRISNIQYSEFIKEYNIPMYGSKCSAGISRFRISPLGEVGPCELMDDISFGNIGNQRLSDILNNDLRKVFVNDFKGYLKKHKCNSCDKRKMCNFCPAYFELETGIKNNPSKYICSITEMKMKLIGSR